MATATHITGPLHKAARNGNINQVRFLLQRKNHDPNLLDSKGRPVLFAACQTVPANVEVVRLLLEAGADPAVTDERGVIPLHLMVQRGHVDLVDMLYSAAPATLNQTATKGQTALYVACRKGDERMVSKLLSLGAMEPTPRPFTTPCPLAQAAMHGFLGIARLLTSEGGFRAVGGEVALPKGLHNAVVNNQAMILRLLLAACGESRRSEWANIIVNGRSLLYLGAGLCSTAAVSILLEAGGDETREDPDGLAPRDVVGHGIDVEDGVDHKDPWKVVAILRMLDRGAAYKARSWGWPPGGEADVGVSGVVEDDITAAVAAAPSCVPAMTNACSVYIKIVWPKDKNSMSKLFVTIVSRYCSKQGLSTSSGERKVHRRRMRAWYPDTSAHIPEPTTKP